MGGLKLFVARLSVAVVTLLSSPHFIPGQQPQGQQRPKVSELLRQFEAEKVFWRQIEVAKAIVEANDLSVLPRLQPWLTIEDRHLRGNAAFIFARLGDSRGFDVIVAILTDRSESRAVWKIEPEGKIEKWISGEPLDKPVGITYSGERLLIADPHAKKVFEVSLDGKAVPVNFEAAGK